MSGPSQSVGPGTSRAASLRVGAALISVLALLSGSAQAQDGVTVRTRPDAVGDRYRFQADAKYAEKTADGEVRQENRQVFEVEVLGVEEDGLRLRYTLREVSLTDTSGPAMETALKALIGLPLEFRVRGDGMISALDNWDDYKARVLAAVDAALSPQDPIRNTYHQRFAQTPINAAEDMVLADVRLMAIMEPKGAVVLGMTDVVDNRRRPPGRAVSTLSVTKPGCEVRVVRASASKTPNVVQDLTTDAAVSMVDGRVLSLVQKKLDRAGGETIDEAVTIKRLSAAPGC